MKIDLGKKYRCKITGYEGVATGFCEYISGCNQVLLAHSARDGESKSHWFDVQRLEEVPSTRIVLENAPTPGFDSRAPKR